MGTRITDGHDYKAEGRKIDVKLLRALAMGGKRSVEIQLLLDSQVDGKAGYQALALLLTDLSVQESRAQETFETLREHQKRMTTALGRQVGIKAAALDFLENIERALNIKEDEQVLTYNQLAQMALRDDLTGLANFRYFMRRFNEEIKRADRYKHLLSLLMIDIDFFKNFNDKHGHPAGNKALEHVAAILTSEVRETDLVGRYGGEEFAVILPETTKREAHDLAERIRTRVEKSAVTIDTGAVPLTISVGLATYPRDAQDSEAALTGADAALYESKKTGRNKTSVFKPATFCKLAYTPEQKGAARSVSVMGDFNGWDKNSDSMQKDDKGTFSLSLHLAPGRYVYKFLINGEWFMADPASNEFVVDGYGGRNSVMVVK